MRESSASTGSHCHLSEARRLLQDPSATDDSERLARLLEKAKERRYFEVPVPVAEYDSAPGREAVADQRRIVR